MTDRLHLVRALPSDLSQYIDLLEAIADWLVARGVRQYTPDSFRASRPYFAESIGRGEVHWAHIDAERVGSVRMLNEDPLVWPDAPKNDATYLYNLVVYRLWGHRGVGRHILERAEREARARRKVFLRLDCAVDNQFLRQYYADAGFLARGEIEVRYPDPIGRMHLQRFEKRVLVGPGTYP